MSSYSVVCMDDNIKLSCCSIFSVNWTGAWLVDQLTLFTHQSPRCINEPTFPHNANASHNSSFHELTKLVAYTQLSR